MSLKALRISATAPRCSTAHFTPIVRKTGVFRRDVENLGEPVGLGQFQNWIWILRGGDRRENRAPFAPLGRWLRRRGVAAPAGCLKLPWQFQLVQFLLDEFNQIQEVEFDNAIGIPLAARALALAGRAFLGDSSPQVLKKLANSCNVHPPNSGAASIALVIACTNSPRWRGYFRIVVWIFAISRVLSSR